MDTRRAFLRVGQPGRPDHALPLEHAQLPCIVVNGHEPPARERRPEVLPLHQARTLPIEAVSPLGRLNPKPALGPKGEAAHAGRECLGRKHLVIREDHARPSGRTVDDADRAGAQAEQRASARIPQQAHGGRQADLPAEGRLHLLKARAAHGSGRPARGVLLGQLHDRPAGILPARVGARMAVVPIGTRMCPRGADEPAVLRSGDPAAEHDATLLLSSVAPGAAAVEENHCAIRAQRAPSLKWRNAGE